MAETAVENGSVVGDQTNDRDVPSATSETVHSVLGNTAELDAEQDGVIVDDQADDCHVLPSTTNESIHSAHANTAELDAEQTVDDSPLNNRLEDSADLSTLSSDHQEIKSGGLVLMQEAYSQPAVSSIHSTATADLSASLPPARLVTLTSPIPSLVQSLRISAVKTVKRTRQSLAEKLGHGSKTVDLQLDARIECLRDVQRRYTVVLQLVNVFTTHFTAMTACHQALSAEFSDLAQKMPELHNEFAYNAETQRVLHKNGETLLGAMKFFSNTLNTLCYKTIEDTLLTVKQYEDARMEYDAFRIDVESKNCRPETQQTFQQHKLKFEQMRQVLDVKFQLLDENRVKVMRQQLVLFHNSLAAYFSGNQTALDGTVQQFNVPQAQSLDTQH